VQQDDFQHILRVLNTNIDGKQKIVFALTAIKGVGRRFANVVCKKADVDLNKRYHQFWLIRRIYVQWCASSLQSWRALQ